VSAADATGLLVEHDEGVAVLTIDRPDQMNALNDRLMRALADTLAALAEDDAVSVVLITSTGDRAFSVGVDLKAFGERMPTGPDDDWYALVPFMRDTYPKPVVTAVSGYAVGGGFELLLSCDLVVATEHSQFGLPEAKRGLLAGAGSTDLPRRIPLGVALEMGLTGDRISAQRAYELGLVNALHPPETVRAEALALAKRIAANGPVSLRLTKELMYATLDVDRATMRARADEAGAFVNSTEDAIEGPRAFVEKRAPRWTGR
jgi:enoyl-CoA hydratase